MTRGQHQANRSHVLIDRLLFILGLIGIHYILGFLINNVINKKSTCAQGDADKVDVLLALLNEAPPGAWLLWADFDTVFANRAFTFPFRQYRAEGRHLVAGGSLAEVQAGNGYSELSLNPGGPCIDAKCSVCPAEANKGVLPLRNVNAPKNHVTCSAYVLAEADTGVLLLRNTEWVRTLYKNIRTMLDSRATVAKVGSCRGRAISLCLSQSAGVRSWLSSWQMTESDHRLAGCKEGQQTLGRGDRACPIGWLTADDCRAGALP